MPKLNTYPLNTAVDAAFQMLGIIPGAGSTFQTVRVSPAALIAFIQEHSAAGVDGREVEMQKNSTHVQWRYVGDPTWINLIPLTDITGPSGSNGDEVEMRVSDGYIQWKLVTASTWVNLIAVVDLKGEAGTGLVNRGNWAAGTYSPGDYVFAPGSVGSSTSMWVLSGSAAYASSVTPKDDASHWVEMAAPSGADGREVNLQVTQTHIQWRYAGDSSWSDLVALASLKGETGNDYNVLFADKGTGAASSTHIFDLSAAACQRLQVGGALTVAISNWKAAGQLSELLIELVNGGSANITGLDGIRWIKSDGSYTTTFANAGVTLQASGTDWVFIWSRDGGATVWGKVVR